MLLKYLSIPTLTAEAGADPWALDKTLQAGAPGEINQLANAFYEAGVSMSDTNDEFNQAKTRFQEAWDRQDGGAHPINESAEVLHATQALNLTREQLTRVAVDLEAIAAALAEAQQSSKSSIQALETSLQTIDDEIDRLVAAAAADGSDVDWSALEQQAIDRTAQAASDVRSIQVKYTDVLDGARLSMAEEGYLPDATEGADGRGGTTPESRAQSDAEKYDAGQRALDESLVNAAGPSTPEKQAAAGRLRDYVTITNPNADPEASRYAAERLNDYYTAQFAGPLPKDPILGGDARSRAQSRLDLQRQLEQGLVGSPPMTADQATEMLDAAESHSRAVALERARLQLERLGMSPSGTDQVLKNIQQYVGFAATGTERYGDAVPTGKHALDGLSPRDAATLASIAGHVGKVSDALTLGVAVRDYFVQGGPHANQQLGAAAGSVAGGMGGGWAAGTAAAMFAGPWTAAGVAVVGSIVGGSFGGHAGGTIGDLFDPITLPSGGGGKSW